MEDIIIYGNIHILNSEGRNMSQTIYFEHAINVQQKGFNCVPYKNIVLENGMVKHATGTINYNNKIFQFKCRLKDTNISDIPNIFEKMNNEGFFYKNWKYADFPRDYRLECFSTKNEQIINKLFLLSKNDLDSKKEIII